MSNKHHEVTVEVGDQFKDNTTNPALDPRVIQVTAIETDPTGNGHDRAIVKVIAHWNDQLVGRFSRVSLSRLATKNGWRNGYTKISR